MRRKTIMLTLKRILFVALFLLFWIGSIFLYASGASGTFKESVFWAISLFWVAVFVIIGRKVFGKQAVDPDAAAAAVIAQLVGTDSFDDVDLDG